MPHIARLEAVVDELVVVWSPSLYVRSRGELVTAIFDHDDAITEIGVEIVGEAIGGPMIYIEWQVKGRFVNPGFLDDDLLIEPSHSQIETAGVLVYAFARERVRRIRCFYDGVALLEQVLPSAAGRRSDPGSRDGA